jgi:tRNA A37 threonylcarbamoyladenosine modification protein TsaB
LVKQAELSGRVRELNATLVTAEEKVAEIARQQAIEIERVPAPGPEVLAALAFAQLDRGVTVRPDDLDANYIRRSDAEIFSAPLL